MFLGGCGIDSCGRSECGNGKSDVGPRFEMSIPADNESQVPLDQFIIFYIYSFSSFLMPENLTIEISENNGSSFSLAFDGTSFIPPYSGTYYRPDSQQLTFNIIKASNWNYNSRIVVRTTGTDEYGNSITKELLKKWE